ncbi:MAG: radical SAM/SPASM domain-containing protein [Verrucomicrobia bacterium]|nr:radical SAM/SPASM domain-containing protein [Verrucomicrobiota bacterium]
MNQHGNRNTLRVVAWETTRRCALKCRHCRGAARDQEYPGELTTEEGFRLIDGIAAFSKPILILTGGEPMTRTDIYDLARHATSRGLRVAMAPCGPLITAETAAMIKDSGVMRISISIDGATAAAHDAFRGVEGAFEAAMRGINHAKKAGLEFQINTTLTRLNVAELQAIYKLALDLGAAAFDVFFLVPTGRGSALKEMEMSPDEYEASLKWMAGLAGKAPITVKTTCAPHFARLQAASMGGHGGGHAGGCMGGRGFVFVSHRGIAQPCGFLDLACGDIRAENFNFKKIYEESGIFNDLRDVDGYGGKCGLCEYRNACGGCRARAYVQSGNYLDAEPSCTYVPRALRESKESAG